MPYNKCVCQQCGNQYATRIEDDEELQKAACPGCGAKQLKISGPMSFAEISGLFSGGG